MTAVNPVGTTATSSTGTNPISATEDRFLKLLVAQMRNQDPLNPLDNAQVTSQMAQLSTVTGINQLNTLVQGLTSSLAQSQSMQATNMIGRGVLTDGSAMILNQGSALAGFELASPADHVLVSVKDGAGQVIHTADLGAQAAGVNVFQWDGVRDDGTTSANGVYSFDVQATSNGNPVTATKLSYGTVASVTMGTNSVQLNLLNLGAVDLSQIKQVM